MINALRRNRLRSADRYDTIVVGGRSAGTATAMLLARSGQRVLVLETERPGTDPESAQALQRGAVARLHRWGLLDAVVDAGTPAVHAAEFRYGDSELDIFPVRRRAGVDALYAPRRTVLDPVLARAAAASGAQFRFGTRATGLLRDRTGRVVGVEAMERGAARPFRATAALTVGADGLRSTVAEAVEAPVRHSGPAAGGFAYGYWSELPGPHDRYRLFARPGSLAGAIPTNHGLVCAWVAAPRPRFDAVVRDPDAGFRAVLARAAPALAGELAGATPVGPVRVFPGAPSVLRAATGPGWALVGDAGWFADPVTTHGMTGALVGAELLARAILAGPGALPGYERARDELARPLLAVADRIATYRWDLAELRGLLVGLSRALRPAADAVPVTDRPDVDAA